MRRKFLLGLAGVLLIQTLLVALASTPLPHPGGDNAGYVSLAQSILDRGAYLELWDPGEPPHTKYPPVFPALLALCILLGAKSWTALKLVPAFSTVLAVAFTFLWARERRGLGMGLAVALLLGLSESLVYYSQWILSDPTFLALTMAALWLLQNPFGASESSTGSPGPEEGGRGVLWLAVGMVLVVLAYFTRSAGLPLVGATFLWLGIRRRWKTFLSFALAFGVPAALWWLRGTFSGGADYVSEFWLIDPYQPELGTVGLVGLLGRMLENLRLYVTLIVPGGIIGEGLPVLPPLGIGLGLITLVGWIKCVREGIGVSELFFPLYFGLILLWPSVWSGDRFALPLLPLVFFYAGAAVLWLLGSFSLRLQRPVVAALVLALAFPASLQWLRMSREAGACRELTRTGNARGCLPPAQGEYFALAEWSGENLPEGAIVTTRKPRTFFVMSGLKAQSIPLVTDPDEFLTRVRERGSRYLSLDLIDGLAGYYAYPVVLDRMPLFCGIVEVGGQGQAGTQLLGVREARPEMDFGSESPQGLARCPEEMFRADPRRRGSAGGWVIPLLSQREDAGE